MTKDNIIDDPAILIDINDNDLDKGEWGLTHMNSYSVLLTLVAPDRIPTAFQARNTINREK